MISDQSNTDPYQPQYIIQYNIYNDLSLSSLTTLSFIIINIGNSVNKQFYKDLWYNALSCI